MVEWPFTCSPDEASWPRQDGEFQSWLMDGHLTHFTPDSNPRHQPWCPLTGMRCVWEKTHAGQSVPWTRTEILWTRDTLVHLICFKLDIKTVVVVFSLACSADRPSSICYYHEWKHIIIPVISKNLSAQNSTTFFRIWVLGLDRISVQTALLYFPFVCILFLLSSPHTSPSKWLLPTIQP